MSIRYMNWAWELELPPVEKLVLLKLADNANDSGGSYPSIKLVAQQCSISARTAQRVVKRLSTENVVRVEKRFRRDGSQSSNHYTLIAPFSPGVNLSPSAGAVLSKQTPGDIPGCHNNVTPGAPRCGTPKTTNDPSTNQQQQPNGGGRPIFFPNGLTESERASMDQALQALEPELAQAVMDELAGRMRINQVREPLRYLARLIERAKAGTFTSELSAKEKAGRDAAAAQVARKQISPIPKGEDKSFFIRIPKETQAQLLKLKKSINEKKQSPTK